jgi:four helix bundle protein
MDGVCETYKATEALPQKEQYGLQSQMRRAAVSVPCNIAEGQARGGRAAVNHLNIALGSLAELDTQLEAAIRLKYLTAEGVKGLRQILESTTRLTAGLRRAKRLRLVGSAAATTGLFLFATAIAVLS